MDNILVGIKLQTDKLQQDLNKAIAQASKNAPKISLKVDTANMDAVRRKTEIMYQRMFESQEKTRQSQENMYRKMFSDIDAKERREISSQQRISEAEQQRIAKQRQATEDMYKRLFIQQEEMQRKAQPRGLSQTQLQGDMSDTNLRNQIKSVTGLSDAHVKLQRSVRQSGQEVISFKATQQGLDGVVRTVTGSIDSASGRLTQMSNTTRQVAQNTMSLRDSLREAVRGFASFSLVMGSIYGVLHAFQEGIQIVKDFDAELIQLRMVGDLTSKQADDLAQQFFKLGDAMGQNALELAKVQTALVRQGLTMDESTARMKTLIEISKVAAMPIEETTEKVTAVVNAMGESAQRTGDVVNYLANATATESNEILSALQRTASSAGAVNMSLEETATLIAVISSKTRLSGEDVGNSVKSIIGHLSRVKDETGDINKDYDKTIQKISQFVNVFEDGSNRMRPIFDILRDLGNVWDDLSQKQQRMVASSIGVFQVSKFSAMLDGLKDSADGATGAMDLLDGSMKSAGTTTELYSTYLQSTEASAERAKNAFQQLWMNAISSETVRGFYNLVTAVTQFTDKVGVLNLVAIALGTTFVFLNDKLFLFVSSIGQAIAEAGLFGGAIAIATGTTTLFGGALSGAAIAATALTAALTLGLGVVIGLLISGLTKLVTHLVNARAEQEQFARENVQSMEDIKASLDEEIQTREKYLDLIERQTGSEKVLDGYRKEVGELDKLIESNTELYNVKLKAAQVTATQELPSLEKEFQATQKSRKELEKKLEVAKKAANMPMDAGDRMVLGDPTKVARDLAKMADKEKELGDSIARNKKILGEHTIASRKDTEAMSNRDKAISKLNQIQKDMEQTTKDAETATNSYFEAQNELQGVLDNVRSKEKLNVKQILEVGKTYGVNLIPFLNDRKKLEAEISRVMAAQTQATVQGMRNQIAAKKAQAMAALKLVGIEARAWDELNKKWFTMMNQASIAKQQMQSGIATGKATKDLSIMGAVKGAKDLAKTQKLAGQEKALMKFGSISMDISNLEAQIGAVTAGTSAMGDASAKAGSKGSKASKDRSSAMKEEEKYVSDLELKYRDLETVVERLEDQGQKLSETPYEETEIQFAQRSGKIIENYKQQEDALHALNNARRKERNDLMWTINQIGKQVGLMTKLDEADRIVIDGYANLNKITGKNTEDTNELIKQTEEYISTLLKLDDQMDDTSTKWRNNIESMKKTMNELNDKLKEGNTKIADIQKEMSEARNEQMRTEKDQIVQAIKTLKSYEEEQKKALETSQKNIENLEKQIKEMELQAKIDPLEEEIKALEKKKDLEDKEAKRKKLLLDLEQARINLINAQNEKVLKVFTGKSFEFQADPDKIQSAQESYDGIVQNIKDLELQDKKDAIQKQIDDLKALQDAQKQTTAEKLAELKKELDAERLTSQQIRYELDQVVAKRKIEVQNMVNDYNTKWGLREQDKLSFEYYWSKEDETITARINSYQKDVEASRKAFEDKQAQRQKELDETKKWVDEMLAEYARLQMQYEMYVGKDKKDKRKDFIEDFSNNVENVVKDTAGNIKDFGQSVLDSWRGGKSAEGGKNVKRPDSSDKPKTSGKSVSDKAKSIAKKLSKFHSGGNVSHNAYSKGIAQEMGLNNNEVPAILKEGETVIPNGAKSMGDTYNIQIDTVETNDATDFILQIKTIANSR